MGRFSSLVISPRKNGENDDFTRENDDFTRENGDFTRENDDFTRDFMVISWILPFGRFT